MMVCVVCGAFEGELLTHCPGFYLNPEAREACTHGNVIDLDSRRNEREFFLRRPDRKPHA